MSFSSDVKEELANLELGAYHCRDAEMAALLDVSGSLGFNLVSWTLDFKSNQAAVARRTYRLLNSFIGLNPQLLTRQGERLQRDQRSYLVRVSGEKEVEQVFVHLSKSPPRHFKPPEDSFRLLMKDCCRNAYLRGAFLAGGSVNSPQSSSYHLEIVIEVEEHADLLMVLLRQFGIPAGLRQRKGNSVVYLKDRLAIADFLTRCGAVRQRLLYEETLIKREIKNAANRNYNCEMNNLARVVEAGLRQYQALIWLQQQQLLPKQKDGLLAVAEARLDAPEASLQEIADTLLLTKSAVNHRLRKLVSLAEESGWEPQREERSR